MTERSKSDAVRAMISSFREIDIIIDEYDSGNRMSYRTLALLCLRLLDEIKAAGEEESLIMPSLAYDFKKNRIDEIYEKILHYRASSFEEVILREYIIHNFANFIRDFSIRDLKNAPLGNKYPKHWQSQTVFSIKRRNGTFRQFSKKDILKKARNQIGAHFDKLVSKSSSDVESPYVAENLQLNLEFYGGEMQNFRPFNFAEQNVIVQKGPLEVISRNTAAELQLLG